MSAPVDGFRDAMDMQPDEANVRKVFAKSGDLSEIHDDVEVLKVIQGWRVLSCCGCAWGKLSCG